VPLIPPVRVPRRRLPAAPRVLSPEDLAWLVSHGTEQRVPAGAVFVAPERGAGCVVLAGTLLGRDFAAGGRRVMAGDVLGALARGAAPAPLTAETDAVVLTVGADDLALRTAWDPGFPARLRASAVFLTPARLSAARGERPHLPRVAEMEVHQLVEALLSEALAS
jgi:hypothetical protein